LFEILESVMGCKAGRICELFTVKEYFAVIYLVRSCIRFPSQVILNIPYCTVLREISKAIEQSPRVLVSCEICTLLPPCTRIHYFCFSLMLHSQERRVGERVDL